MKQSHKDWCSSLIFFLISSACLIILIRADKAETLIRFKANMEEKVKLIASALEDQYVRNCSSELTECQVKTYDLCEGTGPR